MTVVREKERERERQRERKREREREEREGERRLTRSIKYSSRPLWLEKKIGLTLNILNIKYSVDDSGSREIEFTLNMLNIKYSVDNSGCREIEFTLNMLNIKYSADVERMGLVKIFSTVFIVGEMFFFLRYNNVGEYDSIKKNISCLY